MLSPSEFRELVSGRRRGPCAAALRGLLAVAEIPYRQAVAWRNRRYDSGAAKIYRVEVPVVSVGNLTLGGTGKTPMVQWLARWFLARQVPVALVSRGYGARSGRPNDEALELAMKLPGVPHVQDPDRVAAARRAIDQFHVRAIVLDDAFQHRRIARELDIVLLDALEPFGYGRVFPRGTLREPIAGLARADMVALSRADMLSPLAREEIRRQVQSYAPRAAWLEIAHAPRCLIAADGREQPLDSLAGRRVLAFCGIGNPAGFRHTLASCGYDVAEFCEFADHHSYTGQDAASLAARAAKLDVSAVLCTQKDLVKLARISHSRVGQGRADPGGTSPTGQPSNSALWVGTETAATEVPPNSRFARPTLPVGEECGLAVDRLGDRPLRAVAIGIEILAGQEALEEKLRGVFEQASRRDDSD